MIFIEHKVPHLFREDAYREYCWSVDAYGSYQPASFIYLCFESFFEICLKHNLNLIYPGKQHNSKEFPYKYENYNRLKKHDFSGLIIRTESLETINEIENALCK